MDNFISMNQKKILLLTTFFVQTISEFLFHRINMEYYPIVPGLCFHS